MSMKVFYYFYEIVNDIDRKRIDQYMKEFSSIVRRANLEIHLQIREIPYKFSQDINNILGKLEIKYFDELLIFVGDNSELKLIDSLVIFCSLGSNPAEYCLKKNKTALWGANMGNISFVYNNINNPYIIWHEILHTLGAVDCYKYPDRGPNCEKPNCIMQYEPTKETVNCWPFLCKKNIIKIKDYIKKTNNCLLK